MKIIVNPHAVQIVSTPINEKEINVTACKFDFNEEIPEYFVKEAYFTFDDNTYKQIIVNNECQIPGEALEKAGTLKIGVVAYYADPVNNELIRYNPTPAYLTSWSGSLREAENSEPITPSEMEQFETALNDGLETLDNALEDLQDKVDSGYFKGEKGDPGEPGQTGPTGQPGRDGAIQYTAGDNIAIENDTISADLSNYYTKSETEGLIAGLITDALGGSY